MARKRKIVSRLRLPDLSLHCNRVDFEGCITVLDVPSDKSPSGARGHRVILTSAAAENALPGLIGMAVDYKTGWDGHDHRLKCGIITHAEIKAGRLMVRGYVYIRDFPEVAEKATSCDDALGMSYELAEAHVADLRSSIWTLTRATFTGAAILLRDKAAYKNTFFRVCRSESPTQIDEPATIAELAACV